MTLGSNPLGNMRTFLQRTLFVLLALLAARGDGLRAQWQIVAPNAVIAHDPNTGHGAVGVLSFKDGILWAGFTDLGFSLDSGKTWTMTNLPVSTEISAISFWNTDIGLVSDEYIGTYYTDNRGKSWSFSNDEFAEVFCSSQSKVYGVAPGGTGTASGFYHSLDNGHTWNFLSPIGGVDFGIQNNGVIELLTTTQTGPGSEANFSNDSGTSWSTNGGNFTWDSYCIGLDSCDPSILYIASENYYAPTQDSLSRLFRSSDQGITWQVTFSAPFDYLAGSFSSATHAQYGGTISNGVLRSTDQGMTWKNIGGPNNVIDSRTICAISDNIIFALDSLGNIWATFNSGGDSIPSSGYLSASPTSLFQRDTTFCDSITRSVILNRGSCSAVSVLSTSIIGTDSQSYTVDNLSYDSVLVTLHTAKQGSQNARLVLLLDNGYTDTVALVGYVNTSLDTLIISTSKLFSTDTISCDSLTHSISFNRAGCSPPLVTSWSIIGSDSTSFQVSDVSNDSISVTLYGINQGNQNAQLVLELNNGTSDTVLLAGYVKPNILSTSPATVFTSDTISCDSLARSILFSRTGCSPPSVSSFSIIGADSSSFQASNLTNDSILVTLYGAKSGNQNAQLILHLDNGATDTVALTGYVNLPPNILSASPDTLFATDSISCDSITRSALFSRSGCSPPSVSSWSVIGADSASFRASNLSLDSIQVTLYGTKQGDQSAKLVLNLDNGSSDTVSLSGNVNIIPENLSFATQNVQTDTLGATVSVPITIIGLNQPENVDLVLHYDSVLLYQGSFNAANVKLDIPGEQWPGRSELNIPNAQSGVVAGYARFTVFADSGAKPQVTFDSLDVLSASSPCEYTLPALVTSIITPPSGCGTEILSQFLQDSTIPTFSIHPNPTMGDVELTSSLDLGNAEVEIYDVLGVQRADLTVTLSKDAPAVFSLPNAAGIYYLRIHSVVGVRSMSVVVAK